MPFLDDRLFSILNRGAANPLFDWLMFRLTNLQKALWFDCVVILLVIWALWRGGRRGRAWMFCAVMSLAIGDGSAHAIKKYLIHRDRPCYTAYAGGPTSFPTDRVVGGCPGPGSFPSNHATNMMALAGVCWWFTRRPGRLGAGSHSGTLSQRQWLPWLWFLIPLVIGYTRIYLGYHYVTDVIGGWLIGAFVAFLLVRFVARPLMRGEAVSEAAESGSVGA